MQKTIEALYHGNIYPIKDLNVKIPGFAKCRKQLCTQEEEFCSSLPPELKESYYQLSMQQSNILAMETEQAFIEGFKLGSKLMVDTFADSNEKE